MPALSDESSFYGSENETANLEEQVSTYDVDHYWTHIHPHLYSTIQHDRLAIQAQAQASSSTSPNTPSPTTTTTRIIRPDRPSPNEPIPTFLARLPPSTTPCTSATGPWIYIQSPGYYAPETHIPDLLTQGRRALEHYEEEKSVLEAQRDKPSTLAKDKSGLTRRLGTLRQNLEKRIFAIARAANVVSGKWMLFVTPDKVDAVWGVVAEETARGELGSGAKVSTREDGEGAEGRARLVAIYTRDFGDRGEAERVVRRLVELGVVRRGERPIYYKCDAYTYLGIDGRNPWGLRASLFSSRDVLGERT
ncbi:DUF1917-domain-containing protein [Aspergillus sclerotiicarbonarius CBS 121057]|uniref:DUF1917-domain-containing protein n=1 Tax=Aspergillus sclerotiicarbonarius (strain CBS 121057 / IBT 28362) TaxID=1448318 RepID=A0A319EE78_ASPSB|nr:DUF1917-domain-containing protein [Aspergillus sclerotiicarbonarius CBS 121057]